MRAGANSGRCQVAVTEDGVRGLRGLTIDQLGILIKATMREYSTRYPGGRDLPLPEGVGIVRITDLSLSAYLNRHGVPLIGMQRNPSHRATANQAVEFVHVDHDGSSDRISVQYISSESAAHDGAVRAQKKEAFRVRDRG